jgi:hypothetical protein
LFDPIGRPWSLPISLDALESGGVTGHHWQ